MRVIDSSSLIKYFSREEGWEKVRELLLEGVVTLGLAVKEVANALWKKALRGEVGRDVALRIVRELAEEGALPLKEQEGRVARALEIAMEHGVTVYDALFIALAKELGAELVTSDERQSEAARRSGVRVVFVE